MEKMIQIPEWKFKTIENALRLTNNVCHCHTKETAFDREVTKAYEFAKEILTENEPKVCANSKCAIHPPIGVCQISFQCTGYLSESDF